MIEKIDVISPVSAALRAGDNAMQGAPVTPSGTQAGAELLRIATDAQDQIERELRDPKNPQENMGAIVGRVLDETAEKLAKWEAERLAKLDASIAAATPMPERPTVSQAYAADALASFDKVDPLLRETFYQSLPAELAGVIESAPPRIIVDDKGVPRVAPRISDEAKAQRAYADASDVQRARADNMRAIRFALGSAAGALKSLTADRAWRRR